MSLFRKYLSSVRNNLFLRKHEPLPSTIRLLRELYPSVNWDRVDFYEGLPWYTAFVAPYVTAQALPQFFSFSRYRIYLTKYDESRAQCLADIVHEGMHVMQAMRYMNGYGFGFLRGFIIYYLAFYFKYGYRNNPFEIPAYDQEYRFLGYCLQRKQHGIEPKVNPDALFPVKKDSGLIFLKSDIIYKENYGLLAGGFLLSLLLALAKPILDATGFLLNSFIPKKYFS
jgi:hypothetical protein